MGWIKRMNLKNALFAMMFIGLLIAAVLSISVFSVCIEFREYITHTGVELDIHASSPVITYLPEPTAHEMAIASILEALQIILPILIFTAVIMYTSTLFYKIKLKKPLDLLKYGAERIILNDLDFTIEASENKDELNQLCIVFEKMRKTLLENNQTLWREAEERKRLNAAFAHDLRNPVTVLKGTVKILQRDIQDKQAINRLETYALRIEKYIEVMSSIQRLEQTPVKIKPCKCSLLHSELTYTVKLFAPELNCDITVPDSKTINVDYDIFMIVAENLINNAAQFAEKNLKVIMELNYEFLSLTIIDDGCGYSSELLKNGPKPFGKQSENTEHFGMGLYGCKILCQKHGGMLILKNLENQGASATALFKTNKKS